MKSTIVKQGLALATLTTLGLWGASANAVSCPAAGTSVDTYMNLTASVGTVTCWDYGSDPNPQQNTATDDTPTFNNGILELPTGVDATRYVKSDADPSGFFNYITGDGTSGLAGSFTLDAVQNPQILLFKTGGGNNTPSWFAFNIVGAAVGTVFSWSISGTAPNNGLSHVTAFVPIPAAAWLLGTGLIGLFGIARRRQAVATA